MFARIVKEKTLTMGIRGLFIGIDRYVSPAIDELSYARRDAVALEALFADTLGGSTVLLADADATRARTEQEFVALSGCDADDTVVIAFSGHGSETHEFATHDTDPLDLNNTAIPLDLVQEWFSRIPARRLVLFLYCCFSGGFDAKVLHVDAKPRDTPDHSRLRHRGDSSCPSRKASIDVSISARILRASNSFFAAIIRSRPVSRSTISNTLFEWRISPIRCSPRGPPLAANQFLTVRSFAPVHFMTVFTP
jgi:hypothetical protein